MNVKRLKEDSKKFSKVKDSIKKVKKTTSNILQELKGNIIKRHQSKDPEGEGKVVKQDPQEILNDFLFIPFLALNL